MTEQQYTEALRLYTELEWSMARTARHLRVCRTELADRMRSDGVPVRTHIKASRAGHVSRRTSVSADPEMAWRKALGGQRFEDVPVKRGPVRRMEPDAVEWRAL